MHGMARDILGKENFVEIFLSTPVKVCKRRDLKGMYKKAERGEIKNFTGIDALYEKPKKPDIKINTEIFTVSESVKSDRFYYSQHLLKHPLICYDVQIFLNVFL